jgi:hypothetical protein
MPVQSGKRKERTMATRPGTGGAGIVLFAVTMLALASIINVTEWFIALFRATFYAPNATFPVADVRTWGWIQLVIGLSQLAAWLGIYGGRSWGRWLGIGSAIISVLGQLFFINAAPWWAMVVVGIDLIIIYALTRYGIAPIE